MAKQDQGGNILLNVIVFVKSSDEACIMYRLLVLWNKLLNGIIFIYSKLWFNIMCHLFFSIMNWYFPWVPLKMKDKLTVEALMTLREIM